MNRKAVMLILIAYCVPTPSWSQEEAAREDALKNIAEGGVSDKFCGTKFQMILAMKVNSNSGVETSSFSETELKQAISSATKRYEEDGSKAFCASIADGTALTLLGVVQKQGPQP